MRHVAVMAGTGAIGLVAVFAVDLVNLFYISRLGDQAVAAAVGFAGVVGFFQISICIGVTIGVTAVTSRAIGAGAMAEARQLATSGMLLAGLVAAVLGFGTVALLGPILDLLGAAGRTRDMAHLFLEITAPSLPLLAAGMCLSGVLRAVGDPRRAMNTTLFAAIVTAAVDPLLIFGLHLGLAGAAISTVISRLVLMAVAWHGVARRHGLVGTDIAGPGCRRHATDPGDRRAGDADQSRDPGGGGVCHPRHGAVRVAGGRRAGDHRPALAGGVRAGLCAQRRGRADPGAEFRGRPVRSGAPGAARQPGVHGGGGLRGLAGAGARPGADRARLLGHRRCRRGGAAVLHGARGQLRVCGSLFVANSAFNNLGHPLLSTLFNWGRATLGTIPFVTIGAGYGAAGVLIGQAAGSIVFGSLAVVVAFRVLPRAERDWPARLAGIPGRHRHGGGGGIGGAAAAVSGARS